MSLKAVHLVFIILAALLSVGMGVWALAEQRAQGGWFFVLLAAVCFVLAVALAGYGWWFVKKLKDVSYL